MKIESSDADEYPFLTQPRIGARSPRPDPTHTPSPHPPHPTHPFVLEHEPKTAPETSPEHMVFFK
jgi:hypothetical protein